MLCKPVPNSAVGVAIQSLVQESKLHSRRACTSVNMNNQVDITARDMQLVGHSVGTKVLKLPVVLHCYATMSLNSNTNCSEVAMSCTPVLSHSLPQQSASIYS